MKTKKPKGPVPVSDPKPLDSTPAVPAEEKNAIPRIAIPLRDDGSIDTSIMRESTKQKLREAMNKSPEFQSKTVSGAEVQIFHPAMIGGLYDMLGALESVVVQNVFKIPEPIAKQFCAYTPPEKEALAGPTVRVLNKYAAEWMIKYQDELALATLLTSLTIAKVNAAMMAAKLYRENRATTVQGASQAKSEEDSEKEPPKPMAPN